LICKVRIHVHVARARRPEQHDEHGAYGNEEYRADGSNHYDLESILPRRRVIGSSGTRAKRIDNRLGGGRNDYSLSRSLVDIRKIVLIKTRRRDRNVSPDDRDLCRVVFVFDVRRFSQLFTGKLYKVGFRFVDER
jgi:hypothetical protein